MTKANTTLAESLHRKGLQTHRLLLWEMLTDSDSPTPTP